MIKKILKKIKDFFKVEWVCPICSTYMDSNKKGDDLQICRKCGYNILDDSDMLDIKKSEYEKKYLK